MNILIHATLYPESESAKRANTTMFIHYYAAEWVRAGHSVLVIHHKTVFPKWMVRAGLWIAARSAKLKTVSGYLNGYGQDEDSEFYRDGVSVIRINIAKLVPRVLHTKRVISDRVKKTEGLLARRSFFPDLIVCDFISPGLFVALNSRKNASIAAVIHDTDMQYFNRNITKKKSLDAVRRANILAFRSGAMAREFIKSYFPPKKWFIMHSGVPTPMLRDEGEIVFRHKVRSFLCVARFVHDKRVDAVINAFGMLKGEGTSLDIIGDGIEREALERLASAQPNAGSIKFIGNVSRQDVIRAMERADCFALVSERETFGMVYIEAMSTGAIPIGSAGEGISGIISDGKNGFIVDGGDASMLADKMRALITMSEAEVSALSQAAFDSVREMRDDILAEKALKSLMQK